MCRNGIVLRWRITLAQWLPKEYREKFLSFQLHIIRLREEHAFEYQWTKRVRNLSSSEQEEMKNLIWLWCLSVLADGEETSLMYNFEQKKYAKNTATWVHSES
jgi:hypothetical protein